MGKLLFDTLIEKIQTVVLKNIDFDYQDESSKDVFLCQSRFPTFPMYAEERKLWQRSKVLEVLKKSILTLIDETEQVS